MPYSEARPMRAKAVVRRRVFGGEAHVAEQRVHEAQAGGRAVEHAR